MAMRTFLVCGFKGGAGRSLTAAMLACGLHLQARPTLLVRQTAHNIYSVIEPIEATLPLPCRELMLPAPYDLPPDLTEDIAAMVDAADARFSDALGQLARAEIGADGDVVVDLSCVGGALNAASLRDAFAIVVPTRASVFDVDWAVRSAAFVHELQQTSDRSVPAVLATISPDQDRGRLMRQLRALLRHVKSLHRGLLPDEPSRFSVEAPFLGEATLEALICGRPIWQDRDLAGRCRAFAEAVVGLAEADGAALADHVDSS
ncbi:MAG: hypothetical protein HZA66_17535 [Rhodopseudomonas palustris]|uniref:Uncharacterized protein n=1 Tax=Rhodopseudomonas palustris TaxID=1076 RepID=A0A933RYW8_RHOPL|nr:hypothetical protein [Rhodopseudomonas palustris]